MTDYTIAWGSCRPYISDLVVLCSWNSFLINLIVRENKVFAHMVCWNTELQVWSQKYYGHSENSQLGRAKKWITDSALGVAPEWA